MKRLPWIVKLALLGGLVWAFFELPVGGSTVWGRVTGQAEKARALHDHLREQLGERGGVDRLRGSEKREFEALELQRRQDEERSRPRKPRNQ